MCVRKLRRAKEKNDPKRREITLLSPHIRPGIMPVLPVELENSVIYIGHWVEYTEGLPSAEGQNLP